MNNQVKNIIIRLSLLVGLAAVIFLLVCAKVNRERTQVSGIEVKIDELQDNFFVTKDFVKKLVSDRFDFQNKMMTGKILKKIEQTVEVVPQVKNAIAYVDDNGVLKIEVEQRTPVARVFALNGESFYVDENGDKFPLSPVFSAKAPVITGNIQEDCKKTEKIQSKNLQDAFDVVMQLAQNTIWQSMIGQINVNDKNEIELIPRLGSAIVLLGKPENLAAKMKKLCVFYAEVIGREGWDKYKVINIMYKDQVVCLK